MRTLALLALLAASPAMAEEDYAKLGPNAVSLDRDHGYLQSAAAPDFWALSPFVKPQFTTSACSIASVTAVVNGLSGLPEWASETVWTQSGLLEEMGNADWSTLSAEGGDGVTFDQLVSFTTDAFAFVELPVTVEVFHPETADETNLTTTRALLAANEASADTAVLVYFNQGVVTGDWDGPHVAVIGAYDAAQDRVLILEVDQEWYIPYWTPASVLLEAMVKPTSAEHGVLEGQTGGLVTITKS